MEESVRDALRGLIRRFGHSLREDPARCEGLLRNLCGAHQREINVLIGALRQRVAEELRSASQVPPAMEIERLTRRLEANLGLAPEPARWAVETWALVLGAIDAPLPGALPETSPTPAGIPDIHGWPAAKVQELQRAAARALGRPVAFQDPLRTPVNLTGGGLLARFMGTEKTISQGPEMVIIPAGSFLMGSPEGEERRFGDTLSTDQANYVGIHTYGNGRTGDFRRQTVPVGAIPPNPWGLHEVHGNVWEWCADCWHADYRGAPTDGSEWAQASCPGRAARGGAWGNLPWHVRSATRLRQDGAGDRMTSLGFRVARTLAP